MKCIRQYICFMFFTLIFVSQAPAQEIFNDCSMEGDAKNPAMKELNKLKNRYDAPKPADFNSSITLEAIFESGNDENRWDSSHAAEITGYVYNVKMGGIETGNCHAKDPAYRDTHIELVLGPDRSEKTQRAIVEITPRWRKMMMDNGIDWATKTIRKKLKGRWIMVKGWMMFDFEHKYQSENTNPGGDSNWRATAWEIHPVTGIQIIKKPE